jgi:hypothetical protein
MPILCGGSFVCKSNDDKKAVSVLEGRFPRLAGVDLVRMRAGLEGVNVMVTCALQRRELWFATNLCGNSKLSEHWLQSRLNRQPNFFFVVGAFGNLADFAGEFLGNRGINFS